VDTPYVMIRKAPYSVIIALLAFSALLVSCEKEVHINLGATPSQLVVEGQIETNQPPLVVLTNTVGFYAQVDLTTLQNSFVHGANVQVSNGARTITLREYGIDTGGSGNLFYFYSVDTANLANAILGQLDTFYTLTIHYNGKTYTSVTKIPAPKGVDSMWTGMPTLATKNTPANALQLFVNYTDPDTAGNFVRYFTKINGQPFYAGGVFNDQLINGKRVADLGLYAGFAATTNANGDSLSYFYPGDTVILKWCEIDRGVYTFWNTFAYSEQTLGNPFASPINVQGNISNGALGVWAGYGSTFDTLIIPQ
jgi:Domain of unknown function (DUF4249)